MARDELVQSAIDNPLRHDYEVPVHYAINYLESRPDVDAQRVGLMGVSFGGQFAVRAGELIAAEAGSRTLDV